MIPELTVRTVAGRTVVSTARPWEPVVGYSRAVRSGDWIAVTGCVGAEADGTYPATAAEQMRNALALILASVEALGGRRADIIRTRMFVTDIAQWEEIGRVHGETFADVLPATTMVEVNRLIDAAALVEVEADAHVIRQTG